MARYRIFYLNDSRITARRESAPKPKGTLLQPRHYDDQGEIEAESPYDVWKRLQGEEAGQRGIRTLGVGDAIETESREVLICNFWGFDRAQWISAETHPEAGTDSAERSNTQLAAGQSAGT
jgi:hypothetical protein